MNNPIVAVVILNYNGKTFLQKFLPSVIKHSPNAIIYIADNGSSDDSLGFVTTNFPDVKTIQNGGNYGYAKGYSLALKQITADYFVLLNSDVEVTENWLNPVIDLMETDKKIAACQPKILDYQNKQLFEYAGAAGGFIDKYAYPFCRGRLFNHIEEDHLQYNNAFEVFWATGACLFVRASAFWHCGGLDDDYFAHMEEIDLCWRMKNFGFKIYVQPQSVIYHVGGGTLNKLSKRKTFLNFRNNLTTLTKNHPPKNLLPKIIFRMVLDGVAAFKFLLDGQPKHFFAVIRAHFAYYAWLPKILTKRKQLQNTKDFKYCFNHIYKGNVVAEYFIRGKKKFTDLNRGFFED
ncbi:MAG: glycosyltransferase family 2 protein [Bacteroidia bacterium]|nr:glycosyltransferase family 2 protein [Bacteroidia bacterium]